MSKRWYIVHAYSNFENKVAQSIRDQAAQRVVQFGLAANAARRHESRHERMQAFLNQLVEDARRHGARGDERGGHG